MPSPLLTRFVAKASPFFPLYAGFFFLVDFLFQFSRSFLLPSTLSMPVWSFVFGLFPHVGPRGFPRSRLPPPQFSERRSDCDSPPQGPFTFFVGFFSQVHQIDQKVFLNPPHRISDPQRRAIPSTPSQSPFPVFVFLTDFSFLSWHSPHRFWSSLVYGISFNFLVFAIGACAHLTRSSSACSLFLIVRFLRHSVFFSL